MGGARAPWTGDCFDAARLATTEGNWGKTSRAERLTTYDAAYLELAVRQGLPLLTQDRGLADAAKQLDVVILPDSDLSG